MESDDDLPFACVICRQGFRDPVVTNCGHYFCEQCAQEQYKTNPRCAACGKQVRTLVVVVTLFVSAICWILSLHLFSSPMPSFV